MDYERATRSLSLVLISSLAVFAGWGAGDYLSSTSHEAHHAGGPYTGSHYTGGHGTGFFWYRSGGYRYYGGGSGTGSGFRSGGGMAPGGTRGAPASPSVRGGFGSFGHGAGA